MGGMSCPPSPPLCMNITRTATANALLGQAIRVLYSCAVPCRRWQRPAPSLLSWFSYSPIWEPSLMMYSPAWNPMLPMTNTLTAMSPEGWQRRAQADEHRGSAQQVGPSPGSAGRDVSSAGPPPCSRRQLTRRRSMAASCGIASACAQASCLEASFRSSCDIMLGGKHVHAMGCSMRCSCCTESLDARAEL